MVKEKDIVLMVLGYIQLKKYKSMIKWSLKLEEIS